MDFFITGRRRGNARKPSPPRKKGMPHRDDGEPTVRWDDRQLETVEDSIAQHYVDLVNSTLLPAVWGPQQPSRTRMYRVLPASERTQPRSNVQHSLHTIRHGFYSCWRTLVSKLFSWLVGDRGGKRVGPTAWWYGWGSGKGWIV